MNRKLLLIGILILILGISLLAGCGGGGGKDQSPIEKGPFNDYYGLDINATLTYNYSFYDEDETPHESSGVVVSKVLDEVEFDGNPGFFKRGYFYDGEANYSEIEFIEKATDGYYYGRGPYGENEEISPTREETIIKNPITSDSTSERYGNVIRQEIVNIPAGKFKAWVFCDEEQLGDETETDYFWIVPNLGLIKQNSVTIRNSDSVKTESTTVVLQSYK